MLSSFIGISFSASNDPYNSSVTLGDIIVL